MKPRPGPAFGATPTADGTTFRLWAPSQRQVTLQLGDPSPSRVVMSRRRDGWHEATVAGVSAGARYGFVVDGERLVPDPASRFNPDGVHGLSQVVDPASYRWQNAAWRGRPWHEAVVYELHIGTFTDAGTFRAAADRLDDVAKSGVTTIELMPVAAFPGERNWGYDGVLLFAPQPSYGTPDDLKAFIDHAHGLGLMVLLDVVYNHFGPEGNYLHGYCPEFFNPRHPTPWGAAVNFDGDLSETVRAFYVGNAMQWIDEYRFDGLRLDAIHAIADDSPRHIALEIVDALRDGPGTRRHVHLVLENERNQSSLLRARGSKSWRAATAQWNDDLHHAAHVMLAGETDSYYADYADEPVRDFARALAEGFVFQGQPSPFRAGRAHGEPSATLPSTAFVSFLQNHDQIGNRAFGERLDGLADTARLEAAYACLLLSPQVPMLFMGEEFAASTPFLYFADFSGELADAVSTGRRAEFGRFAAFADESARERIPDPMAIDTFRASRLDWNEREQGEHGQRLALIRRLLTVRAEELVPRLDGGSAPGAMRCDNGAFEITWRLGDASLWLMRANFGAARSSHVVPDGAVQIHATAGAVVEAQTLGLAPAAVWIGRVAP